jgi:hypothetical protein
MSESVTVLRVMAVTAWLRPPHVPDRPAPGFAAGDLPRL